MRKITDEGCLFLYGAGLLVTAETGIPAVIAILFVCIYTDCFHGSRNYF